MKTIKPAIVECVIVIKRTVANFLKKEVSVNNITTAAETVVPAAARIDGPICIRAYLLRSVLGLEPSKKV